MPSSPGSEVGAMPLKNPGMSAKSGSFGLISLRDGMASGYSLKLSQLAQPDAKEALSEGAGQLPTAKPIFGFSRGNLRGTGARVPARGRKPRGAPAAFQDHRREGYRRFVDHPGRLPARIHPQWGQRGHHPRTAGDVLGQLILGPLAVASRAFWGKQTGALAACAALVAVQAPPRGRRLMLALSALGLTWLTACQAGPTQFEPAPPPLRLVASEPSAGEGTECTTAAPPECGVPIGSSITLRFDRYLRASTAVRQSISVYAGTPSSGVGLLRPEYDAVERVLVYRLTQPLEPGTLYTVELLSANSSAALGFQAFDGAPLDDGAAPVKFSFFTRRNREFAPVLPLEPISSCDRI